MAARGTLNKDRSGARTAQAGDRAAFSQATHSQRTQALKGDLLQTVNGRAYTCNASGASAPDTGVRSIAS